MAKTGDQVWSIEVVIDMSTNPRLGVEANGDDGRTLVIKGIREGAIQTWNSTCRPSQLVQPGDRILSANGISGDSAKIIQACQSSKKELKLMVEGVRNAESFAPPSRSDPPVKKQKLTDALALPGANSGAMMALDATGDYGKQLIRINMNMTPGMGLGVDAAPSPDGGLQINHIQEPGRVFDWNKQSPLNKQMIVGDKILSINGVKDTAAMIQQIRISVNLQLLVEGVRHKRTGRPVLTTGNEKELAMMAPIIAQLPAPEVLDEAVREAEIVLQREENAARAEHARQFREARGERQNLQRGPGVAALVSAALKRAQEQTKESKEEEVVVVKNEENAKAKAAEDEKRQEERRKAKEEAAVRAAKVRQAVDDARKKAKLEAEADSLYTEMPAPDKDQEAATIAQARLRETASNGRLSMLPAEDRSKVIFLDVDGVLRPARTGGFEAVSIDGGHAVKVDTSDFFKTALEALRYIIFKTGAMIVMSSEWRRDDTLREKIDELLTKNGIRPVGGCTTTAIERDQSNADVLRSFCERRAREISEWLQHHESTVREWVVIDDVNLATADEHKKTGTKAMGPRLVLTVPLFGLTMGNAKTAIRVLQGEVIQKRAVRSFTEFPVKQPDVEDFKQTSKEPV
eukprot:gnl/MRDRNA2_/MRDRNA2_34097_c0_seq2.p1 gnl/MRDRNA2_/MRDRNA2_34097_c0~~gnl/MRDRNA2_/MRDRNA2_34097_c0_seq2.p1  ORF type:complete len:631 (+),score=137.31 gnl/MRDRNA2_/MRDRNA2_34097_c0_seq2:142-2034(+)